MNRQIFVAGVLALAALPSEAAVMQVVVTGTISDVYRGNVGDIWNGAAVNGAAFQMVFNYDTSVGFYQDYTLNGTTGHFLNGGSNYAQPAAVSASFSIGSQTEVSGGETVGQAISVPIGFNNSDYKFNRYTAIDYSLTGNTEAGTQMSMDVIKFPGDAAYLPDSITTPYTVLASELQTGNISGFFFKYQFDYGTRSYDYFNYLNFTGDKVVVSRLDASPVPLPASFPLLGLGLMALAGLRRRRR